MRGMAGPPPAPSVQVHALPGAPLGAEARFAGGRSLADATAAEVAVLYGAMQAAHGLLVVRDQRLSPPALERAAAKFAPYFGPPLEFRRWPGQCQGIPECPTLSMLGNYRARADGEFGAACRRGERIAEYKPAIATVEEWHTDGSFLAAPKVAIALYAPDVPDALPAEGGQTGFASCITAYARLDRAARAALRRLGTVHSWETFMRLLERRDPRRPKATAADCAAKPDQVWPCVRLHPPTGLPSIYVNPKNTKRAVELASGGPAAAEDAVAFGVGAAPGDCLAAAVAARCVLGEGAKYLHSWRRGDFVLWDNRCLLHAAHPFDADKYERLLFRMEFPGEPVVAYDGPEE